MRLPEKALPTLEEIEAEIRAVMANPKLGVKRPMARAATEAEIFAERLLEIGYWLCLGPDGKTVDDRKFTLFRDLQEVETPIPLDRWDEQGFVDETGDEKAVSRLRAFAVALEAVIPAAPAYAAGLLRQSRNLREILVRSEVAAQAFIKRGATTERRLRLGALVLAVAGIYWLWGRPLSLGVAAGLVLCVVALLKAQPLLESKKDQIARECSELGWPIREPFTSPVEEYACDDDKSGTLPSPRTERCDTRED